MTRADAETWAENAGVELVFYDGYDDAIVGIAERFGGEHFVVYDYERVLRALRRQGMTHEDAVEWYEFNVIGMWVGNEAEGVGPPCFVMRKL